MLRVLLAAGVVCALAGCGATASSTGTGSSALGPGDGSATTATQPATGSSGGSAGEQPQPQPAPQPSTTSQQSSTGAQQPSTAPSPTGDPSTTPNPTATTADGPGVPGQRPAPLIYRPANLSRATKVPLVVALHASGGTPASFAAKSGWNMVANAHHFVVAYLGSASPAWKYLSNVPYISAEITRIVAQQNIDPRRVFVTGFSAGADATYYVGCRLSSQVAAIAPVSGVILYPGCTLHRPLSVLSIFGTHDLIPLGGTPRFPSVYAVTAMFRHLDGCPSKPPASGRSGPVSEQTWSGCRAGSAVSLYIIHGGGHVYPHSAGLPPNTPDALFNATNAIWRFFAAHPAG